MKKIKFLKLLMLSLVTASLFTLSSCKGNSDADIKKNVTEKISTMPDMSNFTVDVKDGVVTLAGQCKDDECKAHCTEAAQSVKGVKSVVSNLTVAAAMAPPVTINADDAITSGVKDAIKDFEGVSADVQDGVITLTGNIKRDRLQNLMQALNTLKPKKINNQLTIK